MSQPIHAFDYLARPADHPPAPVCVLFGNEPFLKRLVLAELRQQVLGPSAEEAPFATFDGQTAAWRDVADELATVSLFGAERPRLVVVDEADPWVSQYRSQLEQYVERPCRTGVLVLVVEQWASNTRLYAEVARHGLAVQCRLPLRGRSKKVDEARLCQWLVGRARHHGTRLEKAAAQTLLELTGPELGLLDQQLAKLALYVPEGGQATAELVREVIGGWRSKTIWELIDAAVSGDAADALRQLHQLLQAGEQPIALLAQIAWSLRRFTAATRLYEQAERQGRRLRLRDALLQAGFRQWPAGALERAEQQLLQLGRQRAGQLSRWLLDADLALKGSHSQGERARFVLEQLILRMARQLRTSGPANRHVAGAHG